MVVGATCTVREPSRLPRCFGGGSRTSKGRCGPADISALLPNAGWLSSPVRSHQREVCPVSRGVMLQPLSGPLPVGLRFLPPPVPAALSGHLTTPLAVQGQQGNGLTTFRRWNGRGWFRPRLFAGGAPSAPGEFGAPGPDPMPFWPKPDSEAAPRRARLTPLFSSTFGANRQRIVEVFPTTHRGAFVAPDRQRIVEVGVGADCLLGDTRRFCRPMPRPPRGLATISN